MGSSWLDPKMQQGEGGGGGHKPKVQIELLNAYINN